jgi:signal transduction histidine kinase
MVEPESITSKSGSSAADYNIMLLGPVARWLREKHGEEALQRISLEAGLPEDCFDGKNRWISTGAFEKVLTAVRALVETDEDFKDACSYRLVESYGPLRMVLLAATPGIVLNHACKTLHMVCRIGKQEVISSERTRLHMRVVVGEGEQFSRLTCLARQATSSTLPTLWGLPKAHIREEACIARGDKTCELHYTWYDQRRWLPIVLTAVLGALLFGLLQTRFGVSIPGVAFGAIVGSMLGYLYELRRAERVNVRTGEEVMNALRALAADEVAARRELVELTERQREWTRLVEEQLAERANTLDRVAQGIDGLQRERVSTLRGFSHDLRNPLFVLRGNTQFLRGTERGAEEMEVLSDMEAAAMQIEQMLQKLLEVASQDSPTIRLTPKKIAVAALADALRRRLRALVFGREIRVSVFCTREAPEHVEMDPTILDRIVDNLLTNAAKYTKEGSIVLELTGTPATTLDSLGGGDVDYLSLKLSDTGQGMTAEQVEKVFQPRPQAEGRTPDSWGIGLSSTVRLLAQVGGRLHVMSRPEFGTTFWAHLPTRADASRRLPMVGDENFESIVTNVVKIRRVENG